MKLPLTCIILADIFEPPPPGETRGTELDQIRNMVSESQQIFAQTLLVTAAAGLSPKKISADICSSLICGREPLASLYSGLLCADHEFCCVFSVQPAGFLSFCVQDLVQFCDARFDAACLETGGELQAFPGIYRRKTREIIGPLLIRGECSMQSYFEFATVKRLRLKRERLELLTANGFYQDSYITLAEAN